MARVLMTGIGESPNVDHYPFLIVFQPWECGVCRETLGPVWWICPLCNRERAAQRASRMFRNLGTAEGRIMNATAFRSPDTRLWTCSECETVWPAELCRCLQCGSNRTYTPYALYARMHGADGMVRDPGTAYFDPANDAYLLDELEERQLQPLDDRATEIPDDEPPAES